MIGKGFRFGMILQLAIGPMCMFIFRTSISHGFWAGEMGVLGTAAIDSLEIMLAIIGVGAVLDKNKKAERVLQIFGVAILLLYGTVLLLSAFHINLLPDIRIFQSGYSGNTFMQAVILALSDPLTIVFWAGIFSAKVAEEKMEKTELRLFASGCVLATLFFLSLISCVGSITKQVIPEVVIRILNALVGLGMFYFAYRSLKAREEKLS